MWRVVLSPRIPDGLAHIRHTWTVRDLYEAHQVLDMADTLDDVARADAHREAAVREAKARAGRKG